MHPSKKFDFSFIRGIIKVLYYWAMLHPGKIIKLWRHYRIFKKAYLQRIKLFKNKNLVVPPLIILSVTMQCNLSCKGCYSRDYPKEKELSMDEINSLLNQAENLGIVFFVITGGEPLLRKGLIELLAKHPNIIFFLFTNSTNINPLWVKNIKKSDHIIPILSLEGHEPETDNRRGKGMYQLVLNNMTLLNQANVLFGFSTMITSHNITILEDNSFIDNMIAHGCRIGFLVNYVPSAKNADTTLVPSKEQQEWFHKCVIDLEQHKRIILIHMPDDEYDIGGSCMAAGKGFLHINAQGYVEPCPFAHLASDTIRNVSLKDALQSPFFSCIRQHPELLTKPQLGCALFEHKKQLFKIANKFKVKPTD